MVASNLISRMIHPMTDRQIQDIDVMAMAIPNVRFTIKWNISGPQGSPETQGGLLSCATNNSDESFSLFVPFSTGSHTKDRSSYE